MGFCYEVWLINSFVEIKAFVNKAFFNLKAPFFLRFFPFKTPKL